MLIYEKDNKLNLNFDPSKSIEDNPDIVIGENEISVSGNNIVSGGGSGGAVTLYFTWDEPMSTYGKAYKDITMTEDFSSYEEAQAILTAATVVKLCYLEEGVIDAIHVAAYILVGGDPIRCACFDLDGNPFEIEVAINSNENPGPDLN